MWQHETPNENISNISQSNSNIVDVASISRNHTGWYHCEVSNAVNKETSNRLLLNVTYIPPVEPMCFSNVTSDKQYLMLYCSWDGGVPKALLWWEGPGNQSKDGQENSNILVLRYGTAHSGKPYTCYAKHPLLAVAKTCTITLG
ncbi:hypothetical protein XENOCAPTIV_005661 [Xenoophorus captivus]|uniref:Ig-like domain-containing protein n=1 Tax=Xenoophorus captivus TaxID=1517983 RepID=A0ABV0RX22_9TELE